MAWRQSLFVVMMCLKYTTVQPAGMNFIIPCAVLRSTYIVEYNFPVCMSQPYRSGAYTSEVMRVLSKNALNNTVVFSHRSAFPVAFDADSIEKWWETSLVFKVYSR